MKIDINDYKIVMMDDDIPYLMATEAFLKDEGYNIKAFSIPGEGLEYIKENEVDILFVDYFMPGMTGEEVIKKTREMGKDIVIVLQTGYAGQIPPIEMFEASTIQGYFDKNSSTEDLLIVLLSAVRSAQLLREARLHDEKEKFFSEMISGASGEVMEKLMSIGGVSLLLETLQEADNLTAEQKDFLMVRLKSLKESTEQIRTVIEALNISTETGLKPSSILKRINILLKSEFIKHGATFITEGEINEPAFVKLQKGKVPYLICKDIMTRLEYGNKNINVKVLTHDNGVVFVIESEDGVFDECLIYEKRLAKVCEGIEVERENNKTKIIIQY